ncbi:MAG: exodeoxyribonuclease V subunit gamma [Opitutaceae bacterium]|nr:exodeoxyribonuclease V subunit gamma [Opitutaceae bacterium]
MSLHLHLAARNDELLASLRPRLAAARTATLARTTGLPRPVPVLLLAPPLGDWLQVQLARDLGLSMGFEFLQPGEYFKRHFAAGPAAAEFAAAHAFWSPERLRWQLLTEVDGIADQLGLDPGQALAPRDRFAFAQLLAQQFDRYARHRPDWPARWRSDQSVLNPTTRPLPGSALADEEWQRRLWRRLAARADAPFHPACLLHQLAAARLSPAEASPPLFIVGTDALDPLLLRTLQTLALQGQVIELHLLLPSLGYLGDIARRHGRSATLPAPDSPEAAPENLTHPLLASLGQQAVGTFLLLDTLTQDYAEWPDLDLGTETPPHASLLQRLQTDIRQQRPPSGVPPAAGQPDTRPLLATTDRSLRVHCCHSPRRELEVLRDELLRAFAELPDLQPEEVLVAVTDFDAYAPLAEAILRAGTPPLPVRLTSIPAREANPIAVALLALLRLALGRHTASELIELLNLGAVQQHLGLAGETAALAQLAEAIRQSGLTHGLDATDRPAGDATGTWRAAIDRHLAGAWFGPVANARDAAGAYAHPLASELHYNDESLLHFAGWLTRLADQLRSWSSPAPAATWANRLEEAVNDLLGSEENDAPAAALRRLLGELAGVSAQTPLDAGTMLDWLQPQLDNATSLRTSMGGEILLGRLDQLHGLPCRVLAILGLQDGAFPRASRRPAWDLLTHRPERFDADPRTQDRQWFLDGLLAPHERLILTAANRSLRSPHDGPLSSCVDELLRVAANTVRPTPPFATLDLQLVVNHRIQPFASDYFVGGTPLPHSFNADAAHIAAGIAQATDDAAPPFFSAAAALAPLATDSPLTLTLKQLTNFWRDPARAWLQALQLEIHEDEPDDTALDFAPVSLDALQAYEVKSTALAAHLSGNDPRLCGASARLSANRTLPPGALGSLAWELRDGEIKPLASGLAPLLQQVAPTALHCTVSGGVEVGGELLLALPADAAPWVLVFRPSKFDRNPKYQLEAFIQTLVATVQLGRPVGCRVLGLDLPEGRQLPAFSPEQAHLHLCALLAGYRLGQRQPLPYAPTTSDLLASALASGPAAEESALEQAEARWHADSFGGQPGGEGTTPAAALAWRDADAFAPPHRDAWLHWARAIAAPLRAWWNAPVDPATSPAAAPTQPTRPQA